MKVTREVILDLLPVYLAGEASPDTRALIDEYLEQDPDLARRVLEQSRAAFPTPAPPRPELELASLMRTRRLLGVQRWLFGFAIAFTAIGLATRMRFAGGRLRDVHLMVFEYPLEFGACLAVAAALWAGYLAIRRRLRTTSL